MEERCEVSGAITHRAFQASFQTSWSGNGCVGVFDSGIGGISVLQAIRRSLPQLNLLYVADTDHAPYGSLRSSDIRQRARRITEFLFQQGAEAVVLACNSATAAAIQSLRWIYSRPLVGMEPAIKPALHQTRTGRIGILATEVTLGSDRFQELLRRWGDRAQLWPQPCPDLVREVERGDWDGPRMRTLLHSYIDPLLAAGVDTLVLGCTHYHFLKPLLYQVARPGTTILEPSYPVARQLARVLSLENAFLSSGTAPGAVHFWTSGDTCFFCKQLERIWGADTPSAKLPV